MPHTSSEHLQHLPIRWVELQRPEMRSARTERRKGACQGAGRAPPKAAQKTRQSQRSVCGTGSQFTGYLMELLVFIEGLRHKFLVLFFLLDSVLTRLHDRCDDIYGCESMEPPNVTA